MIVRSHAGGGGRGLALVVAALAVACTAGPSSTGPTVDRISPSSGTGLAGAPRPNNPTWVFGVAGWPTCLNPVAYPCADSPWLQTTVLQFVLPRLTRWSSQMQLQATPLIEDVPTLANGGLHESPFEVTYHLNPDAVWSDGTAITCADIAFTWRAQTYTSANYPYFQGGYGEPFGEIGIENVDCSHGTTTVNVEFNKPDVDWPELFGGTDGFILERAAFPSVDPERPDLRDEMHRSISFSGGPYRLESWSKGQGLLVRNDRYWGPLPGGATYPDRIAFVPEPDAALVDRMAAGGFTAIALSMPELAVAHRLGSTRGISVAAADGNDVEALWFRLDDPTLRDLRVREALAYALDRDATTWSVAGVNNPRALTNQCGPWIPGQGPWCQETGPFARYAYDPARADDLLEQAGYDCSKVADGGLCTKDGKALSITVSTTTGDVARAATVATLAQGALAAGVGLQLRTYSEAQLFSDVIPLGRFQVALYRQGPVIDPSVTGIFSCNQIPTKANGYGGQNWDRWCNHQADRLMEHSDQSLDPTDRAALLQRVGGLIADELPMIPLFQMPNVVAWRTVAIAGIDPADLSSPDGIFAGVASWTFPP